MELCQPKQHCDVTLLQIVISSYGNQSLLSYFELRHVKHIYLFCPVRKLEGGNGRVVIPTTDDEESIEHEAAGSRRREAHEQAVCVEAARLPNYHTASRHWWN